MSKKTTEVPASESEKKPKSKKVFKKPIEFAPAEFKIDSVSSAENIEKKVVAVKAVNAPDAFSTAADSPQVSTGIESIEISSKPENPVFTELAEPKLPALRAENRARLQMQTPTRLHFYWSLKDNPFETLHRIFGDSAKNYTLVVKLLNQTTNREEIFPVQIEGSWWFNVDADSSYLAEIGFYLPNRPFVRLIFSNSIETPRRNPSPRQASDSDWAVSADSFAQVLDNSGFAQDAFEVAFAGDDAESAETATQAAFEHFFGGAENDFTANDSGEMRFALLALASGYLLEDLREQISPSLFLKLQKNDGNLSAEKAITALRENFGLFSDENTETESLAPTVFGASLINFPRRSKRFYKQSDLPKLSPVSSSKVAKSSR
ncbi:MAG TPA: DUF4912 domain-containing protein [Pyrinomonadaceae bacterium]|nr:DUF4912 domain-containing protein [Pyrinomonadaceae bacterium]